jgi:PAS domain-containing protein
MLLNARKLRPGDHTEFLVLAMEDVTERRRAERLLAEIEAYAQSIVDTVREPLLMLDTTLRVRSANRAFYQTFQVLLKKPRTALFTNWATASGIFPPSEAARRCGSQEFGLQ